MNRIRSSIVALLGKAVATGHVGQAARLSSPLASNPDFVAGTTGEPPVPREHSNLTSSCLSCPSFLFSSVLWPCSSMLHPAKSLFRPYLHSGCQRQHHWQ